MGRDGASWVYEAGGGRVGAGKLQRERFSRRTAHVATWRIMWVVVSWSVLMFSFMSYLLFLP